MRSRHRLYLCIFGILIGTLLSASASAAQINLKLWTFAAAHAQWFKYIAERYTKEVNPNVEIQVSLTTNLATYNDKFVIALSTGDAPDLVDIEHNYFAKYVKGPIPFLELTPLLAQGGYLDKLIMPRQVMYSWQGKTYGIEHALAPVALFYRRDLFANFGFANQINTWDEYVQLGKKLDREKYAMSRFGRSTWEMFIRRQGRDLFDTAGQCHIGFRGKHSNI